MTRKSDDSLSTESLSRRTRRDGRETVAHVISIAEVEIDKVGPIAFNLDRVIESSGISRGSIYHHFGNRAGLIATVEGKRLLQTFDLANVMTRDVVTSAQSGEEFFDFVMGVLKLGGTEEGRATRSRRVSALAAAEEIPALQEMLRAAQQSGMTYYEETLAIAKERGLIDPVVPLRGIANLIQSLLLGRKLVDVLDNDEADADWIMAVEAGLRGVLRPKL